MDLTALQSLLARAADVRVACVGDLMLDRYVYGEVTRISPEAPVPVFRRRSETAMLGAAGNVARNVAALGGRATLFGDLGRDAAGEQVAALLKAEPEVSPCLEWFADKRTTQKTRFVAAGQQLLRLDEEDDPDLNDYGCSDVLALALSGVRCVLVSDYAKGTVSDSVMDTVHAAAPAGAWIVVDPKRTDLGWYGPVTALKPNAAELAAATGLPTGTDEEVEAALVRALESCTAQMVVVTRAGQGMSAVVREVESVLHVRGRPREVFDVSGAGDTSLAALGLALAAGSELRTAMQFAIAAAGLAVEKAGTAVVTAAELLAEAGPTRATERFAAPIVDRNEAARRVADWQERGLRVGFTNGCFDVLHRGHVAYLAQARRWCDRLVVGLNSDRSVRALKGEGRPVHDLESRAVVLGGLAPVDLVVPFDEDTPLALIEALKPQLLVKGADYREDEVVGGDRVRSWGGEVRLADILEGHSTTAAVARIRGAAA